MPNVVPPDGAARHELVILAASAGGIEAIGKILTRYHRERRD
jgi:chemotaxis response regulator CheB